MAISKNKNSKSTEAPKKRWTTEEVNKLIAQSQVKKTREALAKTMKRSVKSIERKADKLNLPLPSKYQRHQRVVPKTTPEPSPRKNAKKSVSKKTPSKRTVNA